MGLIVELLEMYEKNLKEGSCRLVEVPQEQRKPVQVGQIRELWTIPQERFLVLREESGLYRTAPLTSYLQLLPQNAPLYELRRHGLVLGVVPIWDYLKEEIIVNHSKVIGKVSEEEVARIKEYLKQDTDKLPWHTKRFMRLNSRRWAYISLASMLMHAEEVEREWEEE